VCRIVLQDFLSRSHWTCRLWQFLVQRCDTLEAWRVFVAIRPLDEENFALLSDLGIRNVVTGKNTESLKERLVCKSTLEARPGILNQAVQDYESTNLAVGIAIFSDILLATLHIRIPKVRTASCELLLRLQWDLTLECE
jgi:hypothetical protein